MDVSPFLKQPMVGSRVMVTRPVQPNDGLVERLRQLGAEVIVQPTIAIAPPPDWAPVDQALARLDQFDWLVFLSVHGVRFFWNRWAEVQNLDRLPSVRLAAIGPGTAGELARFGRTADLVPERFCAEALADRLALEAAGRRFLIARASRGREVLADRLIAAGATVEQIVVYSSVDVEQADPAVSAALQADEIDWITVTSSAIARSLVRLFGKNLRRAKLASISPLTSETLIELGYRPTVEAIDATMAGLVAAIHDYLVYY
ncbi:MAG: uroporphyrinogen-III synthase [Planctomycetaceae bacterium]|nr:uroporphyrinogen-III synthase [Planctomycetaceae bacterium]